MSETPYRIEERAHPLRKMKREDSVPAQIASVIVALTLSGSAVAIWHLSAVAQRSIVSIEVVDPAPMTGKYSDPPVFTRLDSALSVDGLWGPDPATRKVVVRRHQPPPVGGLPRKDRWFIKFSACSLEEYARKLDYFGIELGAQFHDGQLFVMRNVSKAEPTTRIRKAGGFEDRHCMFLWSIRSNAERSLFAKAGVDVDGAAIVHFYDAKLQAQLEKTETAYRAISASDIRRTYFNVQKDGQGYRFIVTSQSFLR